MFFVFTQCKSDLRTEFVQWGNPAASRASICTFRVAHRQRQHGVPRLLSCRSTSAGCIIRTTCVCGVFFDCMTTAVCHLTEQEMLSFSLSDSMCDRFDVCVCAHATLCVCVCACQALSSHKCHIGTNKKLVCPEKRRRKWTHLDLGCCSRSMASFERLAFSDLMTL